MRARDCAVLKTSQCRLRSDWHESQLAMKKATNHFLSLYDPGIPERQEFTPVPFNKISKTYMVDFVFRQEDMDKKFIRC
jgi:hypothetical protein